MQEKTGEQEQGVDNVSAGSSDEPRGIDCLIQSMDAGGSEGAYFF